MTNDTISDLLTRIRNAQMARHKSVSVPCCRISEGIVGILKQEGYVEGVQRLKEEGASFEQLKVELRYDSNGVPVIHELRRVSTPGCRVYSQCSDLPKIRTGLGIAIISTSSGLLTDREARKRGVGGEILATVF